MRIFCIICRFLSVYFYYFQYQFCQCLYFINFRISSISEFRRFLNFVNFFCSLCNWLLSHFMILCRFSTISWALRFQFILSIKAKLSLNLPFIPCGWESRKGSQDVIKFEMLLTTFRRRMTEHILWLSSCKMSSG